MAETRLKSGRKRRQTGYIEASSDYSLEEGYVYASEPEGADDPYVRDENGRPILLKRGAVSRPRARPAPSPGLKPILIPGSIFAALLLATGELIPAAIVIGGMVLVVAVARLGR